MARSSSATRSRRASFAVKMLFVLIALAILMPGIPIIIYSVSHRWLWPDVLPSRFTLDKWAYVFSPVSQVMPALVNSLIIGLLVSVISAIIGLPAAKVMGQRKFRGKAALEMLFLSPLIIPETAVGLGVLVVFIKLGLANTMLGVIIAHLIPATPYMIRMLSAVFEGYDSNYEVQARSLGASPLKVFWYVTLPIIRPGLVAAFLFVFLISLNNFVYSYLVGGGLVITLPLVVFNYASHGGMDLAVASAASIILTAPCIALLVISERFIKEEYLSLGMSR